MNFQFKNRKVLIIPSFMKLFLMTMMLNHLAQNIVLVQAFLDTNVPTPLHVASFNVRHFGRGVMDKPKVVTHLVNIMSRYDLVVLFETRDKTNTALEELKTRLQNATGTEWRYVASELLGRNKYYMEQYVFLYREKAATFLSSHQFNDTENDVYIREPFSAEFEYSISTSLFANDVIKKRVVLLALHTQPSNTKKELQELPKTIKSVAANFPESDGIIALGDMNADCRYLTGKWRKSLAIFNSPDVKSLISHDADTATKETSDCAYDRVLVYGEGLNTADAGVFNFMAAFNMSQKEALGISDHFPVEFKLY